MLKKLFRRRLAPAPAGAALPAGVRVYAIGDIHGRLDLLDALVARIDQDDAQRGAGETMLVFLGDVIDRGADSAGVVERLRLLAQERPNARFLLGNHEEVFLLALSGDSRALRAFCRIGGRETVLSYGITADEYEQMSYDELSRCLGTVVPPAHREFIESFEDMVTLGDYVFVHAGIRPDVSLSEQKVTDLRWIRDPFLKHRGRLEKLVVHGHTIADDVDFCGHRIGLDTGAYQSGRLSALGLEAERCWTLQT